MAWATTAAATVYHVGPAQAYTQLAQVADLLDPGDTVLVDGDATYDGGVIFTRAGSAGAPIVILGQRINGNRPVISGGTNTVTFESPWPYDSGADHYVFEGFEVAAGTFRGIYHQADDLTVRDVLVRDCPAHGILGADQGSGDCLLELVEVRNCGNGSSQHQIYMATDEVHHPGSVFRMRHCYVHDGDGGNNVKSRAERNEIHYNWIEGAYYHELELIGCDGGDTGNVHLKREDSDVVGNVLRKRRTAAGNDSNFAVTRIGGDGTGMTHGRYRFVNNTVLCGTGAVFRCFDTLESVEMHNNVFYRTGGGVNIMRTVDAGWVHDTAVIAGSNNWVYQGAANIPAQWTGTVSGTDAGFLDHPAGDFRPGTGSPLVNAGNPSPASIPGMEFPAPLFPPAYQPPLHQAATAAAVRPAVATIDIGAYECDPSGVAGGGTMSRPWRPALTASPNPFSVETRIRYELAAPGRVTVSVYNLAGQLVRTLLDGTRPAGRHHARWDGRDDRGVVIAAGGYLLQVAADGARRRCALVKVK
ncbi:MAG: hypothetical protein MUF78_06870 [Candidatus Edwardsbacteria bacterium]|jgi:hypothetical protein|nr:hypothetical protein [Candidatus Edwardsbacteria bacterium]